MTAHSMEVADEIIITALMVLVFLQGVVIGTLIGWWMWCRDSQS